MALLTLPMSPSCLGTAETQKPRPNPKEYGGQKSLKRDEDRISDSQEEGASRPEVT